MGHSDATAVPIARRSCGSCRARRIACDRQVPSCDQCKRAKKKCSGYGMRLSWPTKTNDGRRAILTKVSSNHSKPRLTNTPPHFVRMGLQDVELHYEFQACSIIRCGSIRPRPKELGIPMLVTKTLPPTLAQEWHLLSYFHDVAAPSLATFRDRTTHELGMTVTRIALADDSPASQAVLRAILALASLHRYGLTERTLELKVSSIGALAAASKADGPKTPAQVIQHIAAGMLLCSFEVHDASQSSEQWLLYLLGIKQMLDASPHLLGRDGVGFLNDRDWIAMMNWMMYHYGLARFTMRHWRSAAFSPVSDDASDNATEPPKRMPVPSYTTLFGTKATRAIFRDLAPWGTTCLDWLTDVCDLVDEWPTYTNMTPDERERYKARLRRTDSTIRTGMPEYFQFPNLVESDMPIVASSLPVCQYAMLIYLHRATGGLLGEAAAHLDRDIATAFEIIEHMPTCERQWFLFIIACEARVDEQRAIVLDLMDRNEALGGTRPLHLVRLLVEAVWAQDDLVAAGQRKLGYREKIGTIMSMASIPPSFV